MCVENDEEYGIVEEEVQKPTCDGVFFVELKEA